MKKFSLDIVSFSQKPYFYPVVGVVTFVVINGIVFGFLAFINREPSIGEVAGSIDGEVSEQETPVPTTTPTPTKKPESTPKTTASPSTTPKPTIAPTVKPSSTPDPTPTPVTYEKEEVRINSPEYGKKYDTKTISIKMKALANSEVDSLDIILNGNKVHTFTSEPYEKSLDLDDGDYSLKGKAKLKNGNSISSGDLVFTVKTKADPTPTATPEVTPTPTPENNSEI